MEFELYVMAGEVIGEEVTQYQHAVQCLMAEQFTKTQEFQVGCK